jgi:hypothetical protein
MLWPRSRHWIDLAFLNWCGPPRRRSIQVVARIAVVRQRMVLALGFRLSATLPRSASRWRG